MSRFVCLLPRTVVLCVSLLFATALPALKEGNFTYMIGDGRAMITGFPSSYSGALTIPSTLGGYPVDAIGHYAFQECTALTSVEIPAGVTEIGTWAFYGCSSLKIHVSSDNAYFASLDGVLFNKAYTELLAAPGIKGDYVVPAGVTKIDAGAFEDCTALTSVTIPESVTTIGAYAFGGCTALTSVRLPARVTLVGDEVFAEVAPESLVAASIASGMSSKNLTTLVIPEGVEVINDHAFSNCLSLASVTIPASVASIGTYAFFECTSLSSVAISQGVTSIGDSAFSNCLSLTSVTIPASVASIGAYAFSECTSLSSVAIPKGVTTIGGSAFGYCSALSSVTIPSSVTNIGLSTFYGCTSLSSVTFLGKPCGGNYTSFPQGATGYYPAVYAAEWEALMKDDGTWNGLVMVRLENNAPRVFGDEKAVVEGSVEAGWVVKPSEGVAVVVVEIPAGVPLDRVIVEVPTTATSLTANGAKVRVVKIEGEKRHDITEFLDIPAEAYGIIDLTQVEVKPEIAEEILDTSAEGGAVFDPAAEETPLITAATKPGLTYTLLEGDSIDNLTEGESKVGDGEPWQPQVTQRGTSAFYRIRVSK